MSSSLMHCYTQQIIYSMLLLIIILQNGNTALHFACQHGFEDVVPLLKSSNAKTDIKNHVSLPFHFIFSS